MADQVMKKILVNAPVEGEKQGRRLPRLSAHSGIATLLLTMVIIVGGFMLPTMLYPLLDSYSGRLIPLASSSDDMLADHVFQEQVTLYPWNVYDENQLRYLNSIEVGILEQSGVANLLLNYLQYRGVQLQNDEDVYLQTIIGGFRCLEPVDFAEPACFVLVGVDIDLGGEADIQCAVDLSGKLISLLFVSDDLPTIQLEAPISLGNEEDTGDTEDAGKTGEATDAAVDVFGGAVVEAPGDVAGEGAGPAVGEGAGPAVGEVVGPAVGEATGAADGPANLADAQVPFRPQQEEESIWLYSYVISREALIVEQTNVYSVFRLLDLDYETRFGYPFVELLAPASGYVEILPEIEPMAMNTDSLATAGHLLKIYDFVDGTRLILYFNPKTQNCDGFNLSTVPL